MLIEVWSFGCMAIMEKEIKDGNELEWLEVADKIMVRYRCPHCGIA